MHSNQINMPACRPVIRAVDSSVPSRRMANQEFSAFLDTSDEWIRSHTGIGYRHIAEPSIATSDLAVGACQKVLRKAGLAPEEVDLVLVATATGDFIGFPSVACIVQDKIGAKKAAPWTSGRAARASFMRWRRPAASFLLVRHETCWSSARKSSAGSSTGMTATPACFLAMAPGRFLFQQITPNRTGASSAPC